MGSGCWVQIGPAPTHLWDWDDPDLRAELVVGTILDTYDCAYVKVSEITPEGIMDSFTPPQFWPWSRLQVMECIIFKQPPERADD